MITPGYTKSRSMRYGKVDAVCRFSDRTTSLYFKRFLMMIRPVMLIYYRKNFSAADDEEPEEDENNMSCTDSEEEFSDAEQRETEKCNIREHLVLMKDMSKKVAHIVGRNMKRFGLNQTVSSYRQFFSGVSQRRRGPMQNLHKALQRNENDNSQEVLMLQASHSRQVAETCYAQNSSIFGQRHDDSHEKLIEAFRQASRQWLLDLGLHPTFIWEDK